MTNILSESKCFQYTDDSTIYRSCKAKEGCKYGSKYASVGITLNLTFFKRIMF